MKAVDIAKQPLVPGLPNLIVVDSEASAEEALSMMTNYKIHHLLVSCGDTQFGIVSDRDFMAGAVRSGKWTGLDGMKVRDVMHSDAPMVGASTELREVLALMQESQADAVLIVDGQRILAIVTETDLLRGVRRILHQPSRFDILRAESEMAAANPLAQSIMSLLADIGIQGCPGGFDESVSRL